VLRAEATTWLAFVARPRAPRLDRPHADFPRGLDALPTMMFVAAHVMFLVAGVWAMRATSRAQRSPALLLGLYVASQVGFLAFFGGVITMKLAVLVEQTLMIVAVLTLATRRRTA
jgi:hypothetical protein